MQIIDNLIPKTFQQDLINLFLYSDMPWYYHVGTNAIIDEHKSNLSENVIIDNNTVDAPQFSHSLCSRAKVVSQHYTAIFPILYFLEEKTGYKPAIVSRIKANLLYKNSTFPDNHYHQPHSDDYSDDGPYLSIMSSLIYYLHDSDGDTFFFDQHYKPGHRPLSPLKVVKRITPKQGTAVLFPSNQFHASSSPKSNDRRIVLNFVLVNK